MPVLPEELRAWLEPGLAGVVAVVDDRGRPEVARVWAVRALEGDAIEVHVQHDASRRVVELLAAQRRAALNLVEVTTYRSRTFKGWCRAIDGADPDLVERSLRAVGTAFSAVGLPAGGAERMIAAAGGPSMTMLRLEVDAVFDQSPRPGAGARLA